MSVFEYVTAFVAIVMGLSVARVMSGIGAFLVAPNRDPGDWLVLGWCFALIVVQIGWWMLGWFTLGQLETISYGAVLGWFAATALLFLASYILVPGTGVSLGSPASAMGVLRPAFFACLSLHFCVNLLESAIDGTLMPLQSLVLLMAVLSVSGAFLHSTRTHTVLLVVWVIAMLSLNLLAVPAVGENSGSVLEIN